MPYRVGILGVFHETNTFAPRPTDLQSFAHRWLIGDDVRSAFQGTRTVGGGFLDGAEESGFEVVPLFGAYATPSGVVTLEALAAIKDQIRVALSAGPPLDGLLLELHGAMAAEGTDDPETEIVELIREELVVDLPVAAVLDLHANMGRRRLDSLDVLTGYRTNPHVDTYDAGRRASRLLLAMLGGELAPIRVHRGIPVISAPVAQRTEAAPMKQILARAREIEAAEELLDVTVHAGYAYSDAPHLGMGVSITAADHRRAAAERAADTMTEFIWQQRELFAILLPDAAEAFAEAVRRVDAAGPVALVDTGDNINAGTPGDSTWLLAQALAVGRPQTPDSCGPPASDSGGPSVLATICDPEAVQAAAGVGTGRRLTTQLGGRSHPSVGVPLAVDTEVVRIGDGTFANQGPMATGARVSMGTAAVLRIGSCDVLVQERPVQPNDPELFRCLGLEPADYDIVLLKGAAAVRAGWAGLATAFVDAATPGVSDSHIERLQFRRARRPLWPLDRRPGEQPA